MRTTATHKVILNTPIFKELSMSDQKGQEPKGKQILFSVPVDGKLIPYLLRVSYLNPSMLLMLIPLPQLARQRRRHQETLPRNSRATGEDVIVHVHIA